MYQGMLRVCRAQGPRVVGKHHVLHTPDFVNMPILYSRSRGGPASRPRCATLVSKRRVSCPRARRAQSHDSRAGATRLPDMPHAVSTGAMPLTQIAHASCPRHVSPRGGDPQHLWVRMLSAHLVHVVLAGAHAKRAPRARPATTRTRKARFSRTCDSLPRAGRVPRQLSRRVGRRVAPAGAMRILA